MLYCYFLGAQLQWIILTIDTEFNSVVVIFLYHTLFGSNFRYCIHDFISTHAWSAPVGAAQGGAVRVDVKYDGTILPNKWTYTAWWLARVLFINYANAVVCETVKI